MFNEAENFVIAAFPKYDDRLGGNEGCGGSLVSPGANKVFPTVIRNTIDDGLPSIRDVEDCQSNGGGVETSCYSVQQACKPNSVWYFDE